MVWLFCNTMNYSLPSFSPLSMGFRRQEYRNGLPFLSLEIFLTQGSNPHLLCWRRILHLWATGYFNTTKATSPVTIILDSKKMKTFPLNIRKKAPTLATVIQQSIESPSQSNQVEKRKKRHPNWRGKLSLFADGVIFYIENPIVAT